MKLNFNRFKPSLNQAQQQQRKFAKLAMGRRINSAADDAAGRLIANQLSSSNAEAQGGRNVMTVLH
jgi:flagellin-like hook-associated protein FlgL